MEVLFGNVNALREGQAGLGIDEEPRCVAEEPETDEQEGELPELRKFGLGTNRCHGFLAFPTARCRLGFVPIARQSIAEADRTVLSWAVRHAIAKDRIKIRARSTIVFALYSRVR